MRKNIAILTVLALLALCVSWEIKSQKVRIEALSSNMSVLLDSVSHYKVADSLNAVQVKALRLQAKEFKSLYEEEAEMAKKLKADARSLQATIGIQQQMILSLQSSLVPVVVPDSLGIPLDTLKCFEYCDDWTSVSGCMSDSLVAIDLAVKDQLFIVESIQRKRFLGIPLPVKWFGYRHKTADAVNMNPRVNIECIEFKEIEQ